MLDEFQFACRRRWAFFITTLFDHDQNTRPSRHLRTARGPMCSAMPLLASAALASKPSTSPYLKAQAMQDMLHAGEYTEFAQLIRAGRVDVNSSVALGMEGERVMLPLALLAMGLHTKERREETLGIVTAVFEVSTPADGNVGAQALEIAMTDAVAMGREELWDTLLQFGPNASGGSKQCLYLEVPPKRQRPAEELLPPCLHPLNYPRSCHELKSCVPVHFLWQLVSSLRLNWTKAYLTALENIARGSGWMATPDFQEGGMFWGVLPRLMRRSPMLTALLRQAEATANSSSDRAAALPRQLSHREAQKVNGEIFGSFLAQLESGAVGVDLTRQAGSIVPKASSLLHVCHSNAALTLIGHPANAMPHRATVRAT